MLYLFLAHEVDAEETLFDRPAARQPIVSNGMNMRDYLAAIVNSEWRLNASNIAVRR